MPAPGVFQQLGLFVVPDFLRGEAAAELCRAITGAPAERALVVGPRGVELDEANRKVDSSLLPKEVRSPLKQQVRALLPDLEKHFGVRLADCESLQYLTYQPGHFFKPHQDSGYTANNPVMERRLVSAVIFLNRESAEPAEDAYGQGQLKFYGLLDGPEWEKLPLPLNAEPGLLVAFPSEMFHEVTPVTHGKRFTVVTWFYGPEMPLVPEGAD